MISLHGWIILDKQAGMTSMQAIKQAKDALKKQHGNVKIKIGHAGTLDPFATGILPIALGEATKILQLFMQETKAYVFTMIFGEKRDTGDVTGKVLHSHNIQDYTLDKDILEETVKRFIGNIQQVPHKMSAIKVQGQRAYDLFRAEAEYELQSREVYIEEITLLDFQHDSHCISAKFYVKCGKGVYIRSLCEDIASALNMYAYVRDLDRVEYGPLGLRGYGEITASAAGFVDITQCSNWFHTMQVNETSRDLLRHGNPVHISAADGLYIVMCEVDIVCIGQVATEVLSVVRGLSKI